ncbi:TrbG/VirB9 family P-type conjugative transfer protein, partial [Bordetella pertussis]|uniref:TrbG/VirB9 family P-type conjugative transfer protein n=1 Tax=Bordetella pertussis TaxID=520 RepID=UPI000A869568
MVRSLSIVCLLAVLQACAGSRPAAVAAAWDEAPAGQYRFDWQLSGDPAVAPLQVFDDARRIWLQFAPGQPIPAIFAHGAGGERPVPYLRTPTSSWTAPGPRSACAAAAMSRAYSAAARRRR